LVETDQEYSLQKLLESLVELTESSSINFELNIDLLTTMLSILKVATTATSDDQQNEGSGDLSECFEFHTICTFIELWFSFFFFIWFYS